MFTFNFPYTEWERVRERVKERERDVEARRGFYINASKHAYK